VKNPYEAQLWRAVGTLRYGRIRP